MFRNNEKHRDRKDGKKCRRNEERGLRCRLEKWDIQNEDGEGTQISKREANAGNAPKRFGRGNLWQEGIVKHNASFKPGVCQNKKRGGNEHHPRLHEIEQHSAYNSYGCKNCEIQLFI